MATNSWFLSVLIYFLSHSPILISSDALHPRRPPTEEDFLKMGHHERTMTEKEMFEKIKVIKDRRHWLPWDTSNKAVEDALRFYNATDTAVTSKKPKRRFPNVLILLADDLGYGDLSVMPFVAAPKVTDKWPCSEGGILTPNLERMAAKGAIMTNFHSASPVCSPSRVAIMTSLYPWRLDAMNAFELGRDMSQRNGFLPQVLTGPEIFREAGYYTAHSGKWHIGGMREEMRLDRTKRDQCSRGSPNQHGFEEYVSELDGPESPRYTFLNRLSTLHSKGHRHLLRDDIPMPMVDKPGGDVLSDREAEEAIRVMRENKKNRPGQPWYIQVWFNAPHGPWEVLPTGEEEYSKKHKKSAEYWSKMECSHDRDRYPLRQTRSWQYKTMVTAMDQSIGMLLDEIERLGEEENTIIVFTSDNGPEDGAGTAGVYKEGKRSLMEGGIRVPAIWQWVGTIPAKLEIPRWGATTDILPTLLSAAGLSKPKDARFDGVSLWELLLGSSIRITETGFIGPGGGGGGGKKKEKSSRIKQQLQQQLLQQLGTLGIKTLSRNNSASSSSSSTSNSVGKIGGGKNDQVGASRNRRLTAATTATSVVASHSINTGNEILDRMFLWHKDTDPYHSRYNTRMQSAGYYQDIKILTSTHRGCLDRVFDMKHDPLEHKNLITSDQCSVNFNGYDKNNLERIIDMNAAKPHCTAVSNSENGGAGSGISREACVSRYNQALLSKILAIMPKLAAFAKHGKKVHDNYMRDDLHHATCAVPVASMIKRINFEFEANCTEKGSCSLPEH